jgi:hypothetical protein
LSLVFNTNALGRLATALINGDDNIIERMIARKIEGLGEKLIGDLIGGQFGTFSRIQQAINTGGASELSRMRRDWLNNVMPSTPSLPGSRLLNRLQSSFDKSKHLLTRPEGKHWEWSRSRQEWLNRDYRHDWRTQRRDWHGRWIPGRLRYPYVPKETRRMRAARRRIARKVLRKIMAEQR